MADPLSLANQTLAAPERIAPTIGRTGLKHWAGYISEEFLPELRGLRAYRIFDEMRQNDPVVGGLLTGIESVICAAEWSAIPEDDTDGADLAAADFITSALERIDRPLDQIMSDVCTMFPFGWALLETTYKLEEGRIWWGSIDLRGQDSLYIWNFDDNDRAIEFVQRPAPTYEQLTVPLSKCLLFRTRTEKNNPEGRALTLDTPVPTPDGWTTMGELRMGDRVFDENGDIRHVVATSPIWKNRPVWRLRFQDRSAIEADEEHLWLTQKPHDRVNGHPGHVHATKEIVGQLKQAVGKTSSVSVHGIPWAKPLRYSPQMLLLDPYILGLWLGDGGARSAGIASHADDVSHVVKACEDAGFSTYVVPNGPNQETGLGRSISVHGLGAPLRALGVWGNKHIPEAYMRGSVEQRTALLQGLMDSDGYIDKFGRCEFTNTNESLATGVAELVRSLGCGVYRSSTYKTQATHQDGFAVKFTPGGETPVFRLPRKVVRSGQRKARRTHFIQEAEYVGLKDTVCIEVDSPSHLFLAGRSMIPTHNSILRTAYKPYYYKKVIEEIEAIGAERDLVGVPIMEVPFGATPAEIAACQQIVERIKNDEQSGVVLTAIGPAPDQRFVLHLLNGQGAGARTPYTSTLIQRYAAEIGMSALATFIHLGGSSGRSANQTYQLKDSRDLFQIAIKNWMGKITDVWNRDAIPRLLAMNGMTGKCQFVHGRITQLDLAIITNFITAAVQNKVLTPDRTLEQFLRKESELPPLADSEKAASENSGAPPAGQPGANGPQSLPGQNQHGIFGPNAGAGQGGGVKAAPAEGTPGNPAAPPAAPVEPRTATEEWEPFTLKLLTELANDVGEFWSDD